MAGKYLIPFLISLFFINGCSHRTIEAVNHSLANENYEQAAIRLKRCVRYGKEPEQCSEKMTRFQEMRKEDKKITLPQALKLEHQAELEQKKMEREFARIRSGESQNPWTMLQLAIEIKKGKIDPVVESEVDWLIKRAFFGFGDCAQQADDACMAQYAQMIISGTEYLQEADKIKAKNNAIYWLKLSARYGNDQARRSLLALHEDIPSPDLAMENLQKSANEIAENVARNNRANLVLQQQMLAESRYKNLLTSMQSFFPKTVRCTTHSIGSYTYTSCN